MKGWKRITDEALYAVKGPVWVYYENANTAQSFSRLSNASSGDWYLPAEVPAFERPAEVPTFERPVEFPEFGPWSDDLDALRAYEGDLLFMAGDGAINHWVKTVNGRPGSAVAWCPILKRGRG